MGFFSDFFSRAGRVARGQANKSMDAVETATFEATLKQTVRDMKTELTKVVRSSGEAMSHYWSFYLVTSAGWDIWRAIGNVALVLAAGRPVLDLLTRYRDRFQVRFD